MDWQDYPSASRPQRGHTVMGKSARKEHIKINMDSHFDIEVDEGARFKRMFVSLGCTLRIALNTGIDFTAIDSTFFKNIKFRKGQLVCHLFITRFF